MAKRVQDEGHQLEREVDRHKLAAGGDHDLGIDTIVTEIDIAEAGQESEKETGRELDPDHPSADRSETGNYRQT